MSMMSKMSNVFKMIKSRFETNFPNTKSNSETESKDSQVNLKTHENEMEYKIDIIQDEINNRKTVEAIIPDSTKVVEETEGNLQNSSNITRNIDKNNENIHSNTIAQNSPLIVNSIDLNYSFEKHSENDQTTKCLKEFDSVLAEMQENDFMQNLVTKAHLLERIDDVLSEELDMANILNEELNIDDILSDDLDLDNIYDTVTNSVNNNLETKSSKEAECNEEIKSNDEVNKNTESKSNNESESTDEIKSTAETKIADDSKSSDETKPTEGSKGTKVTKSTAVTKSVTENTITEEIKENKCSACNNTIKESKCINKPTTNGEIKRSMGNENTEANKSTNKAKSMNKTITTEETTKNKNTDDTKNIYKNNENKTKITEVNQNTQARKTTETNKTIEKTICTDITKISNDILETISISSDEHIDIISIKSSESEDCGYHSSDFEFISEEEAKTDGFVIKIDIERNLNASKHQAKVDCNSQSKQKLQNDPYGPGPSNSGRSYCSADKQLTRENYVMPQDDQIVNMFHDMPAMPTSQIHFLENKCLHTRVPALIQYEGLGFDLSLALNQDSDDHEYRDEARESLNKILELYPTENNKRGLRKRRR